MFKHILRRCFSTGSSGPILRYTKTHEWVQQIEGSELKIGITHHAQRELGDISFVVPPTIGKTYLIDQEAVVIESTKAVGEIKMPIDGIVTQINQHLDSEAKLINDDPEGSGWIFQFKPLDLNGGGATFLSKLLDREQYQEYLKTLKK